MSSREKDKNKKDKKLDELETKAAQNLLGWQKALADYQNLQRETDKKIADLSDFISSSYILQLLPIFDNYRLAMEHIPQEQRKEQWAMGLEHILKMWESFLADQEIVKIKAIGEQFDPQRHESVGQVSDESKADQEIVEEKQTGYRLKDRLIRPAKVIINNQKDN
ncbi:MAG: nucleotide exchange factor GrpE [Patescibacteria group bacterium]|nr:nucleotide exchange factor GrpE [Patescibacteria group bacterium]